MGVLKKGEGKGKGRERDKGGSLECEMGEGEFRPFWVFRARSGPASARRGRIEP